MACSPFDTCYSTINNPTPVVCAMFPDAGDGFSQFGCSPNFKICTCSVATTQTTRCTSNQQCNYATVVCSLMTGIYNTSYVNQPCTGCTKELQCLMQGGDSVGRCSCMYQNHNPDVCAEPGAACDPHQHRKAVQLHPRG